MFLIQIVVLCLMVSLAAGCSQKERPTPPKRSSSSHAVTIIPATNVERGLAQHVAGFVGRYCHADTRVAPPVSFTGNSPAEIAGQVRAAENDAIMLVLAGYEGGNVVNACERVNETVAVVNVAVLKENHAQFQRRLEKESTRAVGLLMGLGDCPNPRCCLFAHTDAAQLDAKGRNLCPPCTVRTREALRRRGMKRASDDIGPSATGP